MQQSVVQPPQPPEPPELPEGVAPRWPAWYAGAGFLVALIGTLIAVGVIAAATGSSGDDDDPAFTAEPSAAYSTSSTRNPAAST